MIKFLDLKKINVQYAEELKKSAADVIDSGWFLQGEQNKNFETQLAEFNGSKHAIAVGNGLDALRLILRSYKELGLLCEGDEILVPANTYIATILAITDCRLTPILVEPDTKTLNLNPNQICDHITENTKAILLVHLYGRICWSEPLEQLVKSRNLITIEDNAQAIGASWNGRRAGSLGDSAGFSFYPGKNLGALGDSGAVVTSNSELAEAVRTIANYGSKKKYHNEYRGINSRMDEIQAAFLSIKLKYIDSENQKRREIAQYYCENITNVKITLPNEELKSDITKCLSHVWHLFVIRCKNRDSFQQYLTNKGIQTLIHYPIPPHKQHCYRDWNELNLPITEQIHREVLSLPISSILSNNDISEVVAAVNKW